MSFLRALIGRTKESRTAGVSTVWQAGQPVHMPRDYATFAKEGYQANIVAYRCISLIAECAAAIPWTLYRGDTEVNAHWMLEVLARPNAMQDGISWAEALYSYDLLSGNSYIEGVFAGRSGELYALRPDRMRIVPASDGTIASYVYTVNGRSVTWGADEGAILHLKRFHPMSDYYGMSPLEAAAYAADQHNAGSKWNLGLLQNGMRPSGAVQYEPKDGPQQMGDDEFRRLKSELDEQGASSGKTGRPLLLEGGLKWVQTMLTQHDADFLGLVDKSASQIAQAFQVPEQLVGVPGQQTYNNYREARLALYEDAVLPLVNKYARALTEWMVQPRLGPNWRLSFNEDDIPALAVRKEAQFDRLDGASFLTINEKREALGYEPVDGGDTLLVPAGNLPLSFASEPPDIGGSQPAPDED